MVGKGATKFTERRLPSAGAGPTLQRPSGNVKEISFDSSQSQSSSWHCPELLLSHQKVRFPKDLINNLSQHEKLWASFPPWVIAIGASKNAWVLCGILNVHVKRTLFIYLLFIYFPFLFIFKISLQKSQQNCTSPFICYMHFSFLTQFIFIHVGLSLSTMFV